MSETMMGLVNYAPQPHSVALREVPLPELKEDEVLLEVKAVAICGSDLHQYHGKHSWKVNYPVILGHEFAGCVARTGRPGSSFKPGERVTSETAAVVDPDSPFVRAGLYNLDPHRLGFGYGVNGAMTKFVAVPERCLHRLPDNLSFETAALTEPCCVAFNAVCVNCHIRPGDSVVVLGPGPIGLLCARMAELSGASPLVVVGLPNDAVRLEFARKMGATLTLNTPAEETVARVRALGDGYGVDVVIDASGASASLKLALELVRPGGRISKVGWGPQPCNFSLDLLVAKGVTLRGSFSHNWPIWRRVIAMLASGQLDVKPIVNRVAPLPDWKACFDEMDKGSLVKSVLKP
jgi:alcohol dehydrogenase/L-iditol 2-dehydrogenase